MVGSVDGEKKTPGHNLGISLCYIRSMDFSIPLGPLLDMFHFSFTRAREVAFGGD